MLKKNLKEFDINIFSELEKSWAVITVGNRETGPNPMTVSWGGIGRIWNKNVCYIFVRKSRYSHDILDKANKITISFLSDKYLSDKTLFGKESGRNINKFEKSNLHAGFDPDLNTYIISEAKRVLKCEVIYKDDIKYDLLPENVKKDFYSDNDMHTLYICNILEYLDDEE